MTPVLILRVPFLGPLGSGFELWFEFSFFLVDSIESLCLIKSATPDLPAQRFSNGVVWCKKVFLDSKRILELSPDRMYLGILVQYALKFYYNVTHWKGEKGGCFASSWSSRVVVFWFALLPPCQIILPKSVPELRYSSSSTIQVLVPLGLQNL